ncbi:hypothetical protein DNTS_005498, partial [Danionella cerebrum]
PNLRSFSQHLTLTEPLIPLSRLGGVKMSQLTELVLLTVFLALFSQAEANYEALRIGGLIFTGLLVAGGVGILCWGQCKPKRKDDDDASKI